MSRILAYTSPARGHLFPIVRTLLALKERGHEVHLRTLASEVDLMGSLGFFAEPIDAGIEQIAMDDWKARTPAGAQKRAVGVFLARAEIDAADIATAIDRVRPDSVLVDVNSWGAMCMCEARGVPHAVFTPYSLPIRSKDAPPFGLGLRPRSDLIGRVRDAVVRKALLRPLERPVVKQISALRASMGLGPIEDFTDFVARRGTPLIYLSAEPFEYPRGDWPESVRLVGPGVWDPPAAEPDWVTDAKRPFILVTCSTEFQDDGRLIEAAFKALEGEPFDVVATAGGVDTSGIRVPPGARLERFVPHAPIIHRAACVISHGGMGITQKALAAGVPVVVVPFGRDQFEVAQRVSVAGAGAKVAGPLLNAKRLKAALHKALGSVDGARRIASAFASAGGAEAAADVIEGTLPLSHEDDPVPAASHSRRG